MIKYFKSGRCRMIVKLKEHLNKYIISFLIFTFTLFGFLCFFINKDVVDSILNYYIIFASGIAIIMLFFNNLNDFKWKNVNKISLIIIGITIIWILMTCFLGIRTGIETLKGLVNYSCLLVLGFVIANISLTQKDRAFLLNTIFLSFFLCVLIGIWQYFSGVNLITYSNYLYPGILGRINSTFYIATLLDKYFVIISVVLMYYLLTKPNSKFCQLLYIFCGIGICLTFSRSGFLIFAFVSAIFFLISLFKKQVLNVITVLLTLIFMLLIPGSTSSIQSGLNYVYSALNIPNSLRLDITVIDSFTDKYIYSIFDSDNENNTNSDSDADANTNSDSDADANTNSNPNNNELVPNYSVNTRNFYKSVGNALIKKYQIFGIGVGNYSYLVNTQNFEKYIDDSSLDLSTKVLYPHNNNIHVAAEIGYFGLFLVIASIISLFIVNVNFKKNKLLFFTLILFIFCLLLSGYTESVFNSKQYIFIFIIVFSLFSNKSINRNYCKDLVEDKNEIKVRKIKKGKEKVNEK